MSSDKVFSILKNNWIWFLSLLVSGIIAWTQLKTQVDGHEVRLQKTEQKIDFYDDCIAEQKSLNKLLKAYLKREGVLVE